MARMGHDPAVWDTQSHPGLHVGRGPLRYATMSCSYRAVPHNLGSRRGLRRREPKNACAVVDVWGAW
jgi:hypothetical protein